MPERKPLPKWVPYAGYPAFFLVALVFFVQLTLPYSTIENRVVEQARAEGYDLSMKSLGPGFLFGIKAKGVKLSAQKPTASAGAAGAAAEAPFVLESVSVRPGIFPPGLHFAVDGFGGEITGYVSNRGKGVYALSAESSTLDLAHAGLKPLVGLDLQGKARLSADVRVDTVDFTHTTGTVKLSGSEVVLNGGTVKFIDLPKANLGKVELKLVSDKGKAKIDELSLAGGDIEAHGQGDISLSSRWNVSTLDASVQFKPAESWLKANSFIQTGLAMGGAHAENGFYTATLRGLLVNPRANLKR